MIYTCWKITDKVVKPNYTNKARQQAGQKVQRPAGVVRPTRPNASKPVPKPVTKQQTVKQNVVQEDETEYQAVSLDDIVF
jgi:hypothetical protein